MIKEEITKQIVEDMEYFLGKHGELEFYALSLDCNAEYASFLVCMNTPDDFSKILKKYEKRGIQYHEVNQIKELRYNPGNWVYTGISEISLFGEEELISRYQDDIDTQCSDIMEMCDEILYDLCQTEVYARIPKTTDFISFCIDHEEKVEDALKRIL